MKTKSKAALGCRWRFKYQLFFEKKLSHSQKNENDQWVSWDSGLPELILDFYNDLYTSSQGDMHGILPFVQTKITEEQNNFLLDPYTREEIREAVFSMHLNKV